jgi:hypothetical protein
MKLSIDKVIQHWIRYGKIIMNSDSREMSEEEIFVPLHWTDPGKLYLKWGMQFDNTAFVSKFQHE